MIVFFSKRSGAKRVAMLQDMLQRLAEGGVEMVVLTFNSNHTVRKALGIYLISNQTTDYLDSIVKKSVENCWLVYQGKLQTGSAT